MNNKSGKVNAVISQNIMRLRGERNWTQKELADLYGCTPSFIGQLEQGRRGIGKDSFEKLLSIFKVSEAELLRVPDPDPAPDLALEAG